MTERKIIIGINEITEVIYLGSNLKAKGGKQEPRGYFLKEDGFDMVEEADGCIYAREKGRMVGQNHIKNYRQRTKDRLNVVNELIVNNFVPNKCSMLTLTFDGKMGKQNEDSGSSDIIDEKIKELNQITPEQDFHDELARIMESLFTPQKRESKKDECAFKFQDLAVCNKEFKKFIQRMNYRYEGFKYVAVMARQENGNWHYHMICNISYMKFDELKKVWGLGGAYIRKIGKKEELLKSKNYLKKNLIEARKDLKGEKGYLASKGLKRNIVLRSWVEEEAEEYSEQAQRLNEVKKQVKYIRKRIVQHELPITDSYEYMFSDDPKICEFKYYTYPVESAHLFLSNETAVRKKSELR